MEHDPDEFLTTALLCARYKKSSKTIERWTATGVLPEPQRINGRRYWRRSAIEKREVEGMAARNERLPDKAGEKVA